MKVGGRHPPLAPDPELIRTLAGLLAETGLSEIEYSIGDHRIRVAREIGRNPAASTPAQAEATDEPPAPGLAKPANGAASLNGAAPAGALTSPTVGIAYLAPEPGAAPFVRVADSVTEGQTVLIIEAMKVMNQIRASRSGRVARIFVEDGQPVEYGAPLLLIE